MIWCKYDFKNLQKYQNIAWLLCQNRTPRQVPFCQNKTPRRIPDTQLSLRPYRGEEIHKWFDANMTLRTYRNIRILPDFCVRIKHRAGCPTHSWVSAPYRGEEIQKWFDANMTFRTYRNIRILPDLCVRKEHRATCPRVGIKVKQYSDFSIWF